MGITPPTRTGGQESFENGIEKAMSWLGNIMGAGILFFTVMLLVLELVLNPIFIFAQAKAEGVDVGSPLTSLSWWTIIVVTFATTGIQYALLQPGSGGGIGTKIGWSIAIMDTLMDGGGFAAWVQGGDFWKLSGDSSGLFWGLFPPLDGGWENWVGYGAVCAVCLLHEPFLSMVLGRLNFEPGPEAGVGAMNVLKWTERAGKLHNRVKLVAISFAPYVMLFLDVLLFPQSVKGSAGLIQALWFILTFIVTLLAIVVWEYYNHLRREGGGAYTIRTLDRKHQAVFLGAVTVVVVDSLFDLMGFNQVVYGEGTLFPTDIAQTAPFFLTAGLVMLMVTCFEPLNSDLFMPLTRLAHSWADSGGGGGGGGDDGFDAGGGSDKSSGGMDDFDM